MKKIIFLCLFFIFFTISKSYPEIISGGIEIIEKVPQELFGSWAVSAVQIYTNNPQKYKMMPSLDYWNIYKYNDVLTLENPQSGARASVTVKEINNNTISFTRHSKKINADVTESPTITISGENFFGTDKMIIKNYENNTLISTDVIEFTISGKKISGTSTAKLFK